MHLYGVSATLLVEDLHIRSRTWFKVQPQLLSRESRVQLRPRIMCVEVVCSLKQWGYALLEYSTWVASYEWSLLIWEFNNFCAEGYLIRRISLYPIWYYWSHSGTRSKVQKPWHCLQVVPTRSSILNGHLTPTRAGVDCRNLHWAWFEPLSLEPMHIWPVNVAGILLVRCFGLMKLETMCKLVWGICSFTLAWTSVVWGSFQKRVIAREMVGWEWVHGGQLWRVRMTGTEVRGSVAKPNFSLMVTNIPYKVFCCQP